MKPQYKTAYRPKKAGATHGTILAFFLGLLLVVAVVWHQGAAYVRQRAAEVKHSEMLDDWEAGRYRLSEDDIKRDSDAFFSHYGRRPGYVKKGDR